MPGSLRRRLLDTVLAMLQGIGMGACSDFAFAMSANGRWSEITSIEAP